MKKLFSFLIGFVGLSIIVTVAGVLLHILGTLGVALGLPLTGMPTPQFYDYMACGMLVIFFVGVTLLGIWVSYLIGEAVIKGVKKWNCTRRNDK